MSQCVIWIVEEVGVDFLTVFLNLEQLVVGSDLQQIGPIVMQLWIASSECCKCLTVAHVSHVLFRCEGCDCVR